MLETVISNPTNWLVYMILCSDDSLYIGITKNLPKRFHQHRHASGAKYFRCCRPVRVVYAEEGHNRSTASKREFALKQLKRKDKLLLLTSAFNSVSKYIHDVEDFELNRINPQ